MLNIVYLKKNLFPISILIFGSVIGTESALAVRDKWKGTSPRDDPPESSALKNIPQQVKDAESPKSQRRVTTPPLPDGKEKEEDPEYMIHLVEKLFAEKEYKKLREYFRNDAEKGNPPAEYNLGVTYYAEQKYKKALKWYLKAIEHNHPQAFYNMGVMHLKGEGVPVNQFMALKWFTFAVDLGHIKARETLKILDKEHILDETHRKTQRKLRRRYLKDKDFHEFLNALKIAVARKDSRAQNRLGVMYREGWKEASPDPKRAKDLFRESAKQGYAEARNNLGVIYSEEENDDRASKQFQKAALQGHVLAQTNLGIFYKDMAENYPSAIIWLSKAVKQGNPDAEFMLAGMHYEGKGFSLDENKALKMFTKLAKRGHERSQKFLESLKEKQNLSSDDNRKQRIL